MSNSEYSHLNLSELNLRLDLATKFSKLSQQEYINTEWRGDGGGGD